MQFSVLPTIKITNLKACWRESRQAWLLQKKLKMIKMPTIQNLTQKVALFNWKVNVFLIWQILKKWNIFDDLVNGKSGNKFSITVQEFNCLTTKINSYMTIANIFIQKVNKIVQSFLLRRMLWMYRTHTKEQLQLWFCSYGDLQQSYPWIAFSNDVGSSERIINAALISWPWLKPKTPISHLQIIIKIHINLTKQDLLQQEAN